jgi:type II pantothenate kinase
MVDAIKYVSSAAPIENIRSIGCTGGGAHKFAGEFEEELEITFNKFDELECLVRGMHFALNNFPDECFTYRPEETPESAAPLSTESSSGRDTASAQASSGASTVRITEPAPSPSRTHPRSQAHNTEHTTPSIDEDTTIDASSAPRREKREPAAAPQTPKSPMKKDLKEYTRRVLLPFHSGGNGAAAFPYLVVNIGSGVSILKVTGPGKAERVSGTSLGGGTWLFLSSTGIVEGDFFLVLPLLRNQLSTCSLYLAFFLLLNIFHH